MDFNPIGFEALPDHAGERKCLRTISVDAYGVGTYDHICAGYRPNRALHNHPECLFDRFVMISDECIRAPA